MMNDAAIDADTLSPPILLAADGSLRRVGVEILGPSAQVAAEALAHDLGGTCQAEDPHAFKVSGTHLGDLLIETDLRHVHPDRHPELSLRLGHRMAAWLGTVASPFVPRELITAPIPIARLPEIDSLVASLRSAGAYGRGTVLWNSLGLHFNIDPPRLDAATVMAFLKAFLLVNDRLRREIVRGSFRRALVLPPDYPQAYKKRVLDLDYRPDLPKLTDDYLAANPEAGIGPSAIADSPR
jgi:Putative amidoligase enzyme